MKQNLEEKERYQEYLGCIFDRNIEGIKIKVVSVNGRHGMMKENKIQNFSEIQKKIVLYKVKCAYLK